MLLVYSVSVDPDIDDKQVNYLGHKIFLEKMTNHLVIKNILSDYYSTLRNLCEKSR